jgi:hypothetical protein
MRIERDITMNKGLNETYIQDEKKLVIKYAKILREMKINY